tara:strand:- start:1983 stop:2129 length:147 start_codon:yes stop_codon:yes gene_type:complete
MKRRIYKKNDDGSISVEIVSYTIDNQIAEKEEQLLAMYTEIQKLKQQL